MTIPLPVPDSDVVHVTYRHTEALGGTALDADVSLLSVDERARLARFVFARDRRDFAASHALLRRRLSTHADLPPDAWTFEVEPGGKPHLSADHVGADPAFNLAFNLSHTHGLVACAIGRGVDIGVDVESIDRAVEGRDIATRYFSPDEIRLLDACDAVERQARFIELWTLKEAYVKAIGRGLGHSLATFGFAFDGERGIRFAPPPGEQAMQWTFALLAPSARHRLAVATRSPCAVVRMADDANEGAGTEPLRRSDW
ncbi:MAG: 4'-phosphopantetheinyl transferase superfamily protein [Acidobacteria bacterium]|nr:4'-phosphopantetheinyl transferase superfamily protein [Acidobacteriota bacterium]